MGKRFVRPLHSIALLSFALVTTIACNRAGETTTSLIRIETSNHIRASLPAGRDACFAINIRGGSLEETGNSCTPKMGITVGFVASGGLIEAQVPKNKTIDLELFVYLKPVGNTDPCPPFPNAMDGNKISNVYLVATKKGIPITADETPVELNVNYTGVSVVTALGLPATCVTGGSSASPNHFSLSSGAGTAVGTAISLKGRVGQVNPRMIGTNHLLIVK